MVGHATRRLVLHRRTKSIIATCEQCQRTKQSCDPDFDYDNSYAKDLERKKLEEFLDLKDMINTSRYVYKDPFADHYVPGNNFN